MQASVIALLAALSAATSALPTATTSMPPHSVPTNAPPPPQRTDEFYLVANGKNVTQIQAANGDTNFVRTEGAGVLAYFYTIQGAKSSYLYQAFGTQEREAYIQPPSAGASTIVEGKAAGQGIAGFHLNTTTREITYHHGDFLLCDDAINGTTVQTLHFAKKGSSQPSTPCAPAKLYGLTQ